MNMQVKIKKLNPGAVIPSYAKEGDAGLDLTATSKEYDNDGNIVYGTGLAFEIPMGFVGLLFPRSSNAKTNLRLTNSVGVLDSGYRGEVMFKYQPQDSNNNILVRWWNKLLHRNPAHHLPYNDYNIGDRIGQLIILPYPQIEFKEAKHLSVTQRGTGGYGSTNKKSQPVTDCHQKKTKNSNAKSRTITKNSITK
jgi:dUTP pyrophosphatase